MSDKSKMPSRKYAITQYQQVMHESEFVPEEVQIARKRAIRAEAKLAVAKQHQCPDESSLLMKIRQVNTSRKVKLDVAVKAFKVLKDRRSDWHTCKVVDAVSSFINGPEIVTMGETRNVMFNLGILPLPY